MIGETGHLFPPGDAAALRHLLLAVNAGILSELGRQVGKGS
jgi:hypothetical protein